MPTNLLGALDGCARNSRSTRRFNCSRLTVLGPITKLTHSSARRVWPEIAGVAMPDV